MVDVDGLPQLRVEYRGEGKNFTPEEVSSMVLGKMKKTAEVLLLLLHLHLLLLL